MNVSCLSTTVNYVIEKINFGLSKIIKKDRKIKNLFWVKKYFLLRNEWFI